MVKLETHIIEVDGLKVDVEELTPKLKVLMVPLM